MKVAFLDRDGVINKEVNYLHKVEDFRYTENCISGLKKLNRVGFELIIVTNQAGIAKGFFSEADFELLSNWLLQDLLEAGVKVLDYIFCPHHPDGIVEKFSMACNCRKPNPGMLVSAEAKYNINMEESIMIGDKVSDMQAGINAGVGSCYLVKSGHALKNGAQAVAPVYENLFEVAKLMQIRDRS